MSFIFRSYANIAADVREWSRRLPADIVAVCGIPRSGTIIAGMLAEYRHCHLVEFSELQRGVRPWEQAHRRQIPAKTTNGRVLVIDDTCWTGRTMRATRQLLRGFHGVEYGALYYGDEGKPAIDWPGRRLPTFNHTFEHNMCRDCLTQKMLFDMDGVICEDWGKPDCGPEWAPRYAHFLANAKPLYLPCYRIAGIVTARLRKHRPATEAWLRRHGVHARVLNMAPFDSEQAREKYGHARYKADVYGHSQATLFVESNDAQAREIHQRTNRPAFAVETLTMYGGIDPDPWE